MKKQLSIILVVITTITLLASCAFAWRSIRTGQKNFERAWRAYLSQQPEKAADYYVKAADAFGQALAETPPSRSTMFPSNLAMAGMSLYNAGQYEASINAMEMAAKKDKNLWESYLYAGLSQAQLGNASEAVNGLNAYLDAAPAQAILSAEVEKQITALEAGPTRMDSNIAALEKAMLAQSMRNYTFSKRMPPNSSLEHCSGQYWWRYNKAPCDANSTPLR